MHHKGFREAIAGGILLVILASAYGWRSSSAPMPAARATSDALTAQIVARAEMRDFPRWVTPAALADCMRRTLINAGSMQIGRKRDAFVLSYSPSADRRVDLIFLAREDRGENVALLKEIDYSGPSATATQTDIGAKLAAVYDLAETKCAVDHERIGYDFHWSETMR
jgi:hypothetical protein